MDINYLIWLWQKSNFNNILIKSLPVARLTDGVVVTPTIILHKNQEFTYGKKLNSYEYLKELFVNSIFEYIEDEEMLIVKEIYRR